ncbi:hypothetical protein HKCCE3408_06155 [Rhodobacterales bacterium HKCCE3408]|nr:hypothetical protein [Rhodobacterales bacterium HKCCE3408]
MLDTFAPRCEATVSPELIRLMRGFAAAPAPAAAEAPGLPDPAAATPPRSGPEAPGDPDPTTAPRWPQIALRVDGARPFRFRGLPLCETEADQPVAGAPDGQARMVHRARLFLSEDGDVIAQAICRPEGPLPAHPVHRAGPVFSRDDLDLLLAEAGPRACLDLSAGIAAPPLFDLPDGPTALPGLTLPDRLSQKEEIR